jgi:hypothetical protein
MEQVKRKRGRPRKVKMGDGAVEPIVKKKRGRPAKVKGGGAIKTKGKRGRPKKDVNSVETEKPKEVLEPKSKVVAAKKAKKNKEEESSDNGEIIKRGKKKKHSYMDMLNSSTADLPPETPNFVSVSDAKVNIMLFKEAKIKVPADATMFSFTYKDKFAIGYSRMYGIEGKGWFSQYKWFVIDRNSFAILNEFEGNKVCCSKVPYDGKNITSKISLQMKVEEIY